LLSCDGKVSTLFFARETYGFPGTLSLMKNSQNHNRPKSSVCGFVAAAKLRGNYMAAKNGHPHPFFGLASLRLPAMPRTLGGLTPPLCCLLVGWSWDEVGVGVMF